jgi:hypothetical protein
MIEPTQSTLKIAETSLSFGTGKITETDIPVRHIDISVPKETGVYFPKLLSKLLVSKPSIRQK